MNQHINPAILEFFEPILSKVQSFSFPKRQGATSEVIFVQTDKGQFVCKIAKKSPYRDWLKKEAVTIKCLNEETNLPIPIFYQFNETKVESFLLMSQENGIPLREALQQTSNDSEKLALIESFGVLLKQLHQTQAPASWVTERSWLDEQLEVATYNLQNYEVDGDQSLLEKLKRQKPIPSKQTLIHGDCTIDNVLVVDGKVHMLIDLAGAAYGDPRYDIALAIRSIQNNQEMINAFYKGYELQTITTEEFAYFDEGLYEFF
ncbi:aminoglycoside phosphotransferase family protein [Psychrobacillus sp. NPDC096389]|uniref:aminoglycoside phosphotransferase family protein n=1 Tax=Psychrobacillus sp. NPDC096389 TaxID=3364490 RepID=UPI003820A685